MNQLNIFNKDKIIDIIKENCEILTVKELLNIINYDYNELYIDKFWNHIENDKWLYIDNDMLIWIGYSYNEIKNSKINYMRILTNNFEEDIDYKLINNKEFKQSSKLLLGALENKEINTHNKTKHIIVSPDCFKQSLMLLRTDKSKEIKKYYIELEKIFKFYLEYQNQYKELLLEEKNNELEEKNNQLEEKNNQLEETYNELEEKESELKEEQCKNKDLTNNIINFNVIDKDDYLYIATTDLYSKQNTYKIGKTNNLKNRLCSYNCGRNSKDKYYYCCFYETNNAVILESVVGNILCNFKDKNSKEIYVLNFKMLKLIVENVCKNYNNSIDYYNNLIDSVSFKEQFYTKNTPLKMDIPEKITNIPINDPPRQPEKRSQFTKDLDIDYLTKEYLEENKLIESEILYKDDNEYYILKKKYEDTVNSSKKSFNLVIDSYICNKCFHRFKRKSDLNEHFVRQSDCDEMLRIKYYGEKVIKIYNDKEFYYKYDNEKDVILYTCNICQISYSQRSSLYRHLNKKIACTENHYYNKLSIKLNNDNPIIEIYKGKKFYRYYYEDEDTVKFICNGCKNPFKTLSNLYQHLKYKKC